MSFRIEEKIPAKPYEIETLYRQLQRKGMVPLYPVRTIHSLYFETPQNQILSCSEEGVLPRRKTRIRHYPDEKNLTYQLEVKISSIEGRYKTSASLSDTERNNMVDFGFYDNQYGLLLPKVEVRYQREYCKLGPFRMTFDRHIQYNAFNAKHQNYYETDSVLEIKNPYRENIDAIGELIPFPRYRFSKFSRAMLASYPQLIIA